MVISLCSALGCWRLPADWLGRDSYLILSFLMYMSSLLPARSFSGVNIPQLNSPHRNAAKTSPAHLFLSSFPPPPPLPPIVPHPLAQNPISLQATLPKKQSGHQ